MNKQSISHITILLAGAVAACSATEDNSGWYDTSDMTASGTGGTETGGTETGGTETGGTETGMPDMDEPDREAEPDASDEPGATQGVDWSRLQWAVPSDDKSERALRGQPRVVVVEPGQ